MPRCAALLLDLQTDFLASSGARMPVGDLEAARVLGAANAVLAGQALAGALPVLVANQFPRSAWLLNLFRNGAAVVGTPGASLDARLKAVPEVRVFPKSSSSAFANPELAPYLKANGVEKVFVLGVYAEGCVRATAIEAVRLGYEVVVPLEAVGTNSEVKRRFAVWAMRRAGVHMPQGLPKDAV
jgi:nicotinamidase-related amidase